MAQDLASRWPNPSSLVSLSIKRLPTLNFPGEIIRFFFFPRKTFYLDGLVSFPVLFDVSCPLPFPVPQPSSDTFSLRVQDIENSPMLFLSLSSSSISPFFPPLPVSPPQSPRGELGRPVGVVRIFPP